MSEMISSDNLTGNNNDSNPTNLTVNDYDSDSTIIQVDNKDDETNVGESPTFSADFRSFSPLPSTSSDNITIDLNNTRFNKAIGYYKPLNSPSVLDINVTNEDEIIMPPGNNQDQYTTKLSNDFTNIIECSSDSDSEDNLKTAINVHVKKENNSKKKRRKKKLSSEVIDLLLDDFDEKIYDSDCEIVDVDLLIAENNAVLNRHSQNHVIELNETTDSDVLSNAVPVQDITQSASVTIPPEEKPTNTFEKMKMIVKDFFDRHSRFLREQTKDGNNFKSSPGSVINVMSLIKTPHNIEKRKKRERKRDRPTKVKRRKVVETIDLSDNSSSNPRMVDHRGPEIIVIDSDSSMIVENSSNIHNSNLEVRSSPVVNFQNIVIPGQNVQATPTKNYGECPVCLESFSKVNAVSTFCGHIFCATCMNKIKSTSKKCPKCRKSLGRGKGFHPIFL